MIQDQEFHLSSRHLDTQNPGLEDYIIGFNQHNAVEFEYNFACTRNSIHVCFIMSPGKMIFAVLELCNGLTVALTVNFKVSFKLLSI